MNVSVIVPTYNGEKKIATLLNALQVQTYQDFELIIIIDGSTDNTTTVIKNFESRFRKIKSVVQENLGRSTVRNRGAQEASGNLLIFFDDDMEPFPDSIEKHVQFHLNHEASILCGNPLELPSKSKTDIQNYKALQTIKWTKHFAQGINVISSESPFLTAANMSLKKTLFYQLGCFDERLTDIEDLEFAKRALKKNIPIYFDTSNQAIHHDYISCRSYVKRVRQYTSAQQKLHALFPKEFHDRTVKRKHKKYFYWMFSFSFWPNLIDRNVFAHILPVFARYKVYEWVIYSQGVAFANKKFDEIIK